MPGISILKFHQLSIEQLYAILALRSDIFVVEQKCAYPELDFHDQTAEHVMLLENDELLGYARLVKAGEVYEQPSIGRVVVKKQHRGKGYARQLFQASLQRMRVLYPASPIKIQAQCYLEDFYKSFGFKTVSEPYPDVGIMHVDMIAEAQS